MRKHHDVDGEGCVGLLIAVCLAASIAGALFGPNAVIPAIVSGVIAIRILLRK